MVSFNKIQKMIDGKWFVKGICFDGDELPLNLNGEEIACGSEIYEVDTGKTFFYVLFGSLNGWINKDSLDFSDGKYKYIYPQSMEELNAVASRHALEFTGIKTSDILLPDFVPSTQFGDLPWHQLPVGNIIICFPFVEDDDNIEYMVAYYDGDTLNLTGSEGVVEGDYPVNIPGGYDYWTDSPDREGDRIIIENEQIFYERSFYGWHFQKYHVEYYDGNNDTEAGPIMEEYVGENDTLNFPMHDADHPYSCWEWVASNGVWRIAANTDIESIRVTEDTTFFGFYGAPDEMFELEYIEEETVIANYSDIAPGTVIGTTYYPFSEMDIWDFSLSPSIRCFVSGTQIQNIPVYRNYSFNKYIQ